MVRNSGEPVGNATGATLLSTAATAAMAVAAIAGGRLDARRLGTWAILAVRTMLGGGIGNLVDRIVRPPGIARGEIIDWIAIDVYPRVFNLADVGLRGGPAIQIWTVISDSVSNRGPDRSQTPETPRCWPRSQPPTRMSSMNKAGRRTEQDDERPR